MADGKMLTWRKFPRDTITNPALRFIMKKLPQGEKHQVFTLFTALYCNADDTGLVDLSDLEVFADTCMMEVNDLEHLLYLFLERNIIEEIDAAGNTFFKITEWLEPYPLRTSNAERQRDYRERKKEKLAFTGKSGAAAGYKPKAPDALRRQNMEQTAESLFDPYAVTEPEDGYAYIADMTLNEITAFLLSNDPLEDSGAAKPMDESSVSAETDDALHGVTQCVTPVTERYTACNAENSRVTQRYTVTPKTEEKEETDRGEEEEKETEEREKENREIETEERENKEEGERRKKRRENKTHTEKKSGSRESGTGESGEREEIKSDDAERKSDTLPTTEADREDAQGSKGSEVKQERKWRPPPEKIRSCFSILWSFFEKNNPMGYADAEREKIACTQLAVRIALLENKKNQAEIIASQFTNCFRRLLNRGGYFENMPCTPQMLLKTGNYGKVFCSVAKILHPADAGGEHWAIELQQAMKTNDKLLENWRKKL